MAYSQSTYGNSKKGGFPLFKSIFAVLLAGAAVYIFPVEKVLPGTADDKTISDYRNGVTRGIFWVFTGGKTLNSEDRVQDPAPVTSAKPRKETRSFDLRPFGWNMSDEDVAKEITGLFSGGQGSFVVSKNPRLSFPAGYEQFADWFGDTGISLNGNRNAMPDDIRGALTDVVRTSRGEKLLELASKRGLYVHRDVTSVVTSTYKPNLINSLVSPYREDIVNARDFVEQNRAIINLLALPGVKGLAGLVQKFAPAEYKEGMNPFRVLDDHVAEIRAIKTEDLRETIEENMGMRTALGASYVMAELQQDLSQRYTRDQHVRIMERMRDTLTPSMRQVLMSVIALGGHDSMAAHVDAVRAANGTVGKGFLYFGIVRKIPAAKVADAACNIKDQFNHVSGARLGEQTWKSFTGLRLKGLLLNGVAMGVNVSDAVERNTLTAINPKVANDFARSAGDALNRISGAARKEGLDLDTPLQKLAADIRAQAPHPISVPAPAPVQTPQS